MGRSRESVSEMSKKKKVERLYCDKTYLFEVAYLNINKEKLPINYFEKFEC